MKKTVLEKKDNSKTFILEFDFGQNLPLPKLNVTSQFYKRLLWVYVFNIYQHNSTNSALYYYTEVEGRKNANSVCSMLYDFISAYCPEETERIVVFSDSCGGQNKNATVTKFLTWLAGTMKVEIEHIYPVRGHSYNVCDRNFALYSRVVRKMENIETLEDYVRIFRASRSSPAPFILKHFLTFRDWATGFKPFTFLHPVNKTSKYGIQKCRIMRYKLLKMEASATYFPVFNEFKVFKCHEVPAEMELRNEPVVVPKAAKINDVRSLMKFVSKKAKNWYRKNVFQ